MHLTTEPLMLIMQGPPPFPFLPGEIAPFVVEVLKTVCTTIAVIALGIPIIRALTRRLIDRPPVMAPIPADVQNRLERIEQAVEAVAIEVERISESQRYLTKLMAEPKALPGARGSANA
jgi:hypothetical protein